MPVRSLRTSVLIWPKKKRVESALEAWALIHARRKSELLAVGYFGSYARGDWSVGSDLDVVAVVERRNLPLERRTLGWDAGSLPGPVDFLVCTREEFAAILKRLRQILGHAKG